MFTSTIKAYRKYYQYLREHDLHNNPWLIDLWGEDPERFETQILCHQDGGEPVEGTNKLSCGQEVWGPTRWPRNAMGEPEVFDPHLTYIITKRCKAIGTTWWDWKAKRSIRLGFDIDSLIGHAAGVGVDDTVISAVSNLTLPYLTIIRSTRGMGRHLYIEFGDPFPVTLNHHEHAAIARALLPKFSRDARKAGLPIDFEASNDVCGGIMWIHHVSANKENQGYEMIRQATDVLTADDLPVNWRDHLSVVSGSRSKVVVRGYTPEGLTKGDELDDMTKATTQVPLDETHDKILDALENVEDYSMIWVSDHHLCQTHTKALEALQNNPDLGIRGVFITNSPGDDGKQNCFMRPRLNGGWDVYRFGQLTAEHETWDRVGNWTHTTFNVEPSFEKLMTLAGGIPHVDERRGFVYTDVEKLKEALASLKENLDLPSRASDDRQMMIRMRKDGKPLLTIERKRGDKPIDFKGFVKTSQGWERVLTIKVATEAQLAPEDTLSEIDTIIRSLKKRGEDENESCGGSLIGWVFKDTSSSWVLANDTAISAILKQTGVKEVDSIKGTAIMNSWLLVNEPFKPDYPGGRKWNRDSAQLRYAPANLDIDEIPSHPWWDKYLNHMGSDLDGYIDALDWPKAWGIRRGGDYLKVWLACMIRYPYSKLPYLFMWGSQETGKSMFHESASILLTKGVVAADKALTNDNGYNGELYNAILAYIDETNVAQSGTVAYNRLKAWTTGLSISIHAKYQQPFEAVNTCHFAQFANELSAMPVMRGDKRITAIQIPPIIDPVPKDKFMFHLEEEASHFIYTLLNWDIPDALSRLRLPVIETATKTSAIEMGENVLNDFIASKCFETPGSKVKLDDFYTEFVKSINEVEASNWSKRRIKRELIDSLPVGRSDGNIDWIGNITFTEGVPASTPYIIVNGRLKKGNK